MAKYKVGDKVKIRQWEDMANEFGTNKSGSIMVKGSFVESMRYMCGNTYAVESVSADGYYRIGRWKICDQMIASEPAKQTLVIYRKGNETIGILKENGKEVKRAVAKLHPNDTYDFNTGAKLIVERIFGVNAAEPEKEQFYNGKVVCLSNESNPYCYTTGKIYTFNEGHILTDEGDRFPPNAVHTFEEWENWSTAKWLEIKE